jgi:anti-sigma B factor antagonist
MPLSPSVELRCDVVRDGSRARIAVMGDLDMQTVPVLEAQLRDLRDAGARELVIDLGSLGFLDSTGLRLLLAESAAARQDGFSLALVPGPPAVQRIFELTATAAFVAFVEA